MKYSIDTSALLDGWTRYYPPDVFPGLWRRLEGLVEQGHLNATEEVRVELERKSDEVFEWACRQSRLFVPISAEIQPAVSMILESFEKLVDTRTNRSACDPFVIALARTARCSVVTGERATGRIDRPNIPDVCQVLGIPCIGLLELIRQENWTFLA